MAEPGGPGGRWGPGRGRAREPRLGISPAILPHPPPPARARARSRVAGRGRGGAGRGRREGKRKHLRPEPTCPGGACALGGALGSQTPSGGLFLWQNRTCGVHGRGSATCSAQRPSRQPHLSALGFPLPRPRAALRRLPSDAPGVKPAPGTRRAATSALALH